MKTLRWSFVLLAVFGLSGAAALAQQTPTMVHAGLRTLYLAPVFIGIDRGIFKANGVEVSYQELESGALSPAAILSGQAHVTSDEILGIAPLAKQGKEFMMVYNLMDRMTMNFVVRNDVLQKAGFNPNAPVKEKAKVLKGLTIGITRPGAPTDTYSRYFMIMAGLDPKLDATLVQIGGGGALECRVPLRPYRRFHAVAALPASGGEGRRRQDHHQQYRRRGAGIDRDELHRAVHE